MSGKNKKFIAPKFSIIYICISNIYELGIERQSLYTDSRTISRNKRNPQNNNNGDKKEKKQKKKEGGKNAATITERNGAKRNARKETETKENGKPERKGKVKGKKGGKNQKLKGNLNDQNNEKEDKEKNKNKKKKRQRKTFKTKEVITPDNTRTISRQVDDTCVKVNFGNNEKE